MAHFAKVENGIVTQVVVVDNEHELNGQAYLNSIGLEGTWVQTSYNNNMRGKFAGLGDVYNAELDRFEQPKPYASWVWDEEQYGYKPPVEFPKDGNDYYWDEESVNWLPKEA